MRKIIIAILIFTGIIAICFGQEIQEKNEENLAYENNIIVDIVEKESENEQTEIGKSNNEIVVEQNREQQAEVIENQNNEVKAQNNAQTVINSQESTKNQSTSDKKTIQTQSNITEKKEQSNQTNQTSQEDQKQEQNNTQKSETEKQYTENDIEYWCVAGGKHHIDGNGTNEHGYYNSWEAAHKAFEEYTKDWASVQYKISACACGKFYFWAIK